MKKSITAVLTASILFLTPLSADWATAKAGILKVGDGDAAFKAAVAKLVGATNPADFMAFAKNPSFKKADVARVLVGFLEHGDKRIRMSAVAWLMQVGDSSVVDIAVPAMMNKDPNVRAMVAQFVAKHAGDRLGEVLKSLLTHKTPEARIAALQCLGAGGNDSSAAVAAGLMADTDRRVAKAAAETVRALLKLPVWLAQDPPAGGAAPKDGPDHLGAEAATVAAVAGIEGGADAVKKMFELRTPESIAAVVRLAGEDPARAQGVLLAALASNNSKLRVGILGQLRMHADPAGAASVVRVFLDDGRRPVRIAAARVLDRMLKAASR